ncbi:MAG: flagellin [Alphaproteobacteria bacterium]
MVVSIKTNSSALVALQQLNATNRELDSIQARVATGLKIRNAKDDAGTFAVAQKLRADSDAYNAVGQSVQRGVNILDISISALETLSNLIISMKSKAVQASDPSLSAANRALVDTDYQAYVSQIATIIDAATFDGFNLINKDPVVPATDDLNVLAEPTASPSLSINVPAINIKAVTTGVFTNVATLAAAQAEVTSLSTILQTVTGALASLGGSSLRLETHSSFITKLQDSLTIGIGSLVDADLGRESARLQSVQIQQQLSTQALQIANSRPQQILSLFQN